MRVKRINFLWAVVAPVVAALLLALPPAAALAQGMAQGFLLEVLESPPAQAAPGGPTIPGTFPPGIGGRLAQATEVGTLAGTGSLIFLTGQAEIHAQSRVPFSPTSGFGTGSLAGVFKVTSVSNGTVVGKLDGVLDLSPFNSSTPLAFANGIWTTLGKNPTAGGFSAVAFVPFPCGSTFCYLQLDAGGNVSGMVALAANEFNKQGVPLVKFFFTLSQ